MTFGKTFPGLILTLALSAMAQNPTVALEQQFQKIAAATDGTLGIAAVHIETGATASLNARQRFPMMSVFKLPIALEVMHQFEQGKLSAEQPVAIRESDMRLGASRLAQRFPHGGTKMTVGELLRLMVVESDNAACDKLLELVGGPAVVQRRMRELGVAEIDISLSELEMWQVYKGIPKLGPKQKWSQAYFTRLETSRPLADRRRAALRFAGEPRNSAEPAAMAELLVHVYRGETLSKDRTAELLRLLAETVPGAARLKGLLPAGTVVAHRGGTSAVTDGLASATNDVGIITLPDGSHVSVAVFLKNSKGGLASRERVIAMIGRAAYDYRWSDAVRR